MEKLERLETELHFKWINARVWIKVLGRHQGLDIDCIHHQKDNESELIAFYQDGNCILIFDAIELKGKLKVSRNRDGRVDYDLF